MYNGIKNPASGLRLDSDYTIYNIEGGFRALVFAIFIFEIHILYRPSYQFSFQFNISLKVFYQGQDALLYIHPGISLPLKSTYLQAYRRRQTEPFSVRFRGIQNVCRVHRDTPSICRNAGGIVRIWKGWWGRGMNVLLRWL